MDKIDSLKLEEERISKLIYDLQSSDVSISREDVIKKLQQIRDYDYMQPNNIQLFIDSFVEAIYVDKNKKIVVVLSLDNNYYSTEHSWCSLIIINGGAEEDRTLYLLNANQALSQVSYSPKDEYYFI